MRSLHAPEIQAVSGSDGLPYEVVVGAAVVTAGTTTGFIISAAVGIGMGDPVALTFAKVLGGIALASAITSGVLADIYTAQPSYAYRPAYGY